jgi:hypothetical protein
MMGKNPEDPKTASTEIRFWNNGAPYHTWSKGLNWYKSLFKGDCCGEKCANYIEQKDTMRIMSYHIPNVKLIVCIRNPIDRAYSEYQMQRNKVSGINRGHIERGFYYKQLINHVIPYFPKENVYVLVQEKLKKNTDEELNKLYKFLGVSDYHLDTMRITSEAATDRKLDLKKDGQIKAYKVWGTEYKPLGKKSREILYSTYADQVEKLFNFLGYEIYEWKDFRSDDETL